MVRSGSGKVRSKVPIDLLIFGPHPDDIEIGLGATVARHAAEGYTVGLVDLTAGELSSNGTPTERRAEAAEACAKELAELSGQVEALGARSAAGPAGQEWPEWRAAAPLQALRRLFVRRRPSRPSGV